MSSFPQGVMQLREYIASHGQSGWDAAWKSGTTPWDSADGAVRKPLKELIEEVKFDLPREGRAIVPGCGRGYDAAYFASRLGLEAWGVDISSAAIEAAKAFVAAMPNPPNNVEFKALDFFNFDLPSDGKKFILAYDYTFFCAIPPAMREAWGKRYAELVSTGGVLLCLIFPIDGDRAGGPPYSVSADAYRAVLEPAFKCEYLEKPLHPVPERAGKELMSVWRRVKGY